MDFDDRPGAGPAMSTIPIPLVEDPKKSVLVETTTGTSDIEEKQDDREVIIKTGADASAHLLPLRDDFDPALTFRSLVLATGLAAFQAVMYQIYMFKPTLITIQGTFIVIIAFFLGKGWSKILPRGDLLEARWRSSNGDGKLPFWIRFFKFINPRAWSLKEHAICAITATSASHAAAGTQVFAAQKLFYNMPLEASTVICTTISIGLFGYGLCGLMRPITVWHVDAVYWSTLPTVKTLQGLNWNDLKGSKPLRVFWYCLAGMFVYEFLPAYVWPWLNSVSIPCLASMHATGATGETLTRLFGGASNNEGLGLFSVTFDWQYITSFQTALPLSLQIHQAIGFGICYIVMLAIYYSDVWNAKSFPFMSTRLQSADGGSYPSAKLFVGGVLSQAALAEYGLPRLTGTFAYSLLMANAAIGALITHVVLFWGKDIYETYKSARQGVFNDRHHEHMVKHYKDAPWWWYVIVLVVSFFLGLIVVLKNNITLSAWAYVVALVIGCIIAPFSTIIYSRYGNGIATNNLSKMLAGLMVPERPVGNMYFAAFSHNVISNAVDLSNDLKMGEYLKIPPRVMFLTQCWGTVFGGFISYVVMVSIVTSNEALLVEGDGNSSWSGATMQSYNTNATAWALASYLYKAGQTYYMVPVGLAIGMIAVIAHRVFHHFVPNIRGVSTSALNLPQLIQYAGYLPYNQTQTCVVLSWIVCGFFTQFYLRNYRPGFFRDYAYMIMGAFDGASLCALFILSFAVFGAAGASRPFPQWWGNNVAGNYDLCPSSE